MPTDNLFEQLLEAQKLVYDFRNATYEVYPHPSPEDSIDFAITELAEALDALLRENKEYKRNREKDHTFEDEIGDALFMLFSVGFSLHRLQVPSTKINALPRW